MGIVSQKLRDSARGQMCTINTHVCNHDPDTVVLCHMPSPIKGMGNKGDDFHAVFGCSACHEVIDNHRLDRDLAASYMLRALRKTQRIWLEMGLLKVPETIPRSKPLSKTVARRHIATGETIR